MLVLLTRALDTVPNGGRTFMPWSLSLPWMAVGADLLLYLPCPALPALGFLGLGLGVVVCDGARLYDSAPLFTPHLKRRA